MTAEADKKRKGGTGRRKIEIRKFDKVERRRSSFSKRYATLFKKAKELQEVCPGSRVAVIVGYPSGKKFKASAPEPHITSVVQAFLASSSSSVHSVDSPKNPSSPIGDIGEIRPFRDKIENAQNPNFEIGEIRPFYDDIENLDCAQSPNFPNFQIGGEESDLLAPSSFENQEIADFLWEDEPHYSDVPLTCFQEWEHLI